MGLDFTFIVMRMRSLSMFIYKKQEGMPSIGWSQHYEKNIAMVLKQNKGKKLKKLFLKI